MTVTAEALSATVGASPLSVKGGRLTLDVSRAPHVSGEIRVTRPSLAVQAALDPRSTPPPRVTVGASVTTPWGAVVTRSFDLTVRGRGAGLVSGEMVIRLASDEALLQDYAPLADDETPYGLATSLRAVINYALGKAIPGATLAASPSVDADVTPYADSINLMPDPSVEGGGATYVGVNCTVDRNDTSWKAVGAKCLNLYAVTSTDSYAAIAGDVGGMRLGMTAGRTYVFSVTGRVKTGYPVGGSVGERARRAVAFWRVGSTYFTATSPALPTTQGIQTRVSVRFAIPADATEAFVRVYNGHTVGEVQWDAFRLSEYTGDPADTGYYDGATTATAGYAYSWTGAANGSTSKRTALISRSIDLMRWKAGVSALDFLAPMVQAAGLRLVCDEARVWTLRGENYQAPGSLAYRAGVNLIDSDDQISRDEDVWYDGAVVEYTWIASDGTTQTAIDAFALTATPSRVVKLERSTPYPGPGLAAYTVRRAQQRGRAVSVDVMTDWAAHAEQPVQIILDGAPTQIGTVTAVTFDIDAGRMNITARTTDTPASAWALIPTGERWIDSPAGASWTSEVISG